MKVLSVTYIVVFRALNRKCTLLSRDVFESWHPFLAYLRHFIQQIKKPYLMRGLDLKQWITVCSVQLRQSCC